MRIFNSKKFEKLKVGQKRAFDESFLINEDQKIKIKSFNNVREPNYVDIEKDSAMKILESANEISNELSSNSTQFSNISPKKQKLKQ